MRIAKQLVPRAALGVSLWTGVPAICFAQGESTRGLVLSTSWVAWGVAILGLILALMIGGFYIRVRRLSMRNLELERQIDQRTSQLEAANKELETLIYSVSHDLRAPLRHVSGFSRILVEECSSHLRGEALDCVEQIERGAQNMGKLMDDLLHLARFGRKPLAVGALDSNELVREVLAILAPESEGRKVEWKIAELPTISGDPMLVRQVFQNLISNALKFTRSRNPAVIEIGSMAENEKGVFFIRDNGVGFDMKYASKLFGVFQRLHRHEQFEGTGIGLATVQRIIHKHGGEIWAEAELEKGATFFFTLAARSNRAPRSKGEAA